MMKNVNFYWALLMKNVNLEINTPHCNLKRNKDKLLNQYKVEEKVKEAKVINPCCRIKNKDVNDEPEGFKQFNINDDQKLLLPEKEQIKIEIKEQPQKEDLDVSFEINHMHDIYLLPDEDYYQYIGLQKLK